MATWNPYLDNRVHRKSGLYPVVVKITHKGKLKHLSTQFSIEEKYWTGTKVSSKHPDAGIINAKLTDIISVVSTYVADCKLHNKPIKIEMLGETRSHSFTQYLSIRVQHYQKKNSHVQARKLNRYILELKECFGGEVFFSDLDQAALRKLEEYLIKNKNKNNTREGKFSRLRQMFDNGIDEGKFVGVNPFNLYHISTVPPKKQKLTEEEFKDIEDLEITNKLIRDGRNMFLFSYYCKGARFENCVMMLKTAVKDGRIEWRINKGKKMLSVKIHAKLLAILQQYMNSEGPFIFPFVNGLQSHPKYGPVIKDYLSKGGDMSEGKTHEYDKMIDVLNVTIGRILDEVGKRIKLERALNFHQARHSFAQHMKKRVDSISSIQDSLGHRDQRTTEIYLETLDDEHLDKEVEKLYGD